MTEEEEVLRQNIIGKFLQAILCYMPQPFRNIHSFWGFSSSTNYNLSQIKRRVPSVSKPTRETAKTARLVTALREIYFIARRQSHLGELTWRYLFFESAAIYLEYQLWRNEGRLLYFLRARLLNMDFWRCAVWCRGDSGLSWDGNITLVGASQVIPVSKICVCETFHFMNAFYTRFITRDMPRLCWFNNRKFELY